MRFAPSSVKVSSHRRVAPVAPISASNNNNNNLTTTLAPHRASSFRQQPTQQRPTAVAAASDPTSITKLVYNRFEDFRASSQREFDVYYSIKKELQRAFY